MYIVQKNNKKLKVLYEQFFYIKFVISYLLIMGVIRECGGKMYLREGDYEKVYIDFFEVFKNYDEFGSSRWIICLKYFVLVNMFMKFGINLFDF